MDLSSYLPMFLAEAREHLQELNLALVRIEERPDDRETVDEIFRIAHSFKGMSATMGFEGTAALTHTMEDVFELLRQRRGGLPREAIDVLLECLDALSTAVENVDAHGEERLDPAPLVTRLEGLVRARDVEEAPEDAWSAGPDVETVRAAREDGRRVLHVACTLGEDAMMPSVRAYMVLAALGEHGDVLASVPDPDGVDAFTGQRIDAWLATEHEDGPVAAAAREVPDVAEVLVGEVDETTAAASAAAVPAPPAEEEPAAPATEDAPAAEATGPGAATGGEPAGRRHGAGAQTVRVDAERLDQLMHHMGELVVHRTQLEGLAAQNPDVPGLAQAMQELTRSSRALQAMVMQVRMIPVEAVFLRFPRLVRDLSTKLGKQVHLELIGQDTELDRSVVDALGDPLVHLVRNALDHGLEPPDEREAAGKDGTGRIEIAARHAGGNVVIEVRDDGRGIDPARVARKAVERGLISEEQAAGVDSARAAELLFAPGFSTAETTSDISGRGVGMDAVRAKVRELGGEATLSSEPGRGTTAQIRLPLTLAIMLALLVEAGGRSFALPLERVERTLRLADHTVRRAAGRRMLVLGDRVLPLVDAAEALGAARPGDDHEHAVIVRGNDRQLALTVGRLVGQQELVTRPLPAAAVAGAPVSGGAVLSSGEIALIVDCDALELGTAGSGATTPIPTAAAA